MSYNFQNLLTILAQFLLSSNIHLKGGSIFISKFQLNSSPSKKKKKKKDKVVHTQSRMLS